MQSLDGQTALVTGAGSGIGRGIALVLAGEGAKIVTVDLDAKRAAAAAAAVTGIGREAVPVTADVSVASEVGHAVKQTVEWSGRLDIVASNAGIFPDSALEDLDEETWDRVMAVNVKATFLLVKAAFPVMRRQKYGRVVVTGSITGPVTGVPMLAHYGASKAALMGLVRGAALEGARDGITVNAVLPGNVGTEGAQAGGGTQYFDAMRPSIPAGRLGRPDDIGWAVRMLAAPEASWITGTGLIADGGQSLPEGGLTAERMAAVFRPGQGS